MNDQQITPGDTAALLYRALHRVKWDLPDDEAWKLVFDNELEDFFNRWEANEKVILMSRYAGT